MSQFQSEGLPVESTEVGKRWWIGPRANPGPSTSVKERLVMAIGYLKEHTKLTNVPIQIWVPIRKGGRYLLTTHDQPYTLDPNCKNLENYRNVSRAYQFSAEEDSEESVGLSGWVFQGKLPEWTPDVRFCRSHEYPRVNYADHPDVRGSLALPVFERGSGTCLGVVEIVMTNQKINYRPELENICHAIEDVDFRSSHNLIPPTVKVFDELYQAALTEIVEVLASVCKTHRLPLALTWAPCIQQGKGGCQHSNENYVYCVSTVDPACFVGDLDVVGFQESCSEYHLFPGQGIVETAFTTLKPCFAIDITAFSKSEYPLAHHARMFGLHAAVAIPIRSIYTGSADFVLEFFLPKDCHDTDKQKQMLNSLSMAVQQACRSLHVVTEKEVEEEFMFPVREVLAAPDSGPNKEETHKFGSSSEEEEPGPKESSWIAHMMEAQQKGKGVSVSLEYLEEPKEEFKVTTLWDNGQGGLCNGQVFSEFGQLQQSSESRGSVEGGGESYAFGGRRSSGGRKSGEKRRTKAEKTISLPVLRQYFAGSLKDAAKSIGVCPTTLKRICRQHGITRWPSRKIKKVGHSLKKLQLVIDSVQGAEGAIQIGSFYSSFPELSSPHFSGSGSFQTSKMNDHPKQWQMNPQTDQNDFYGHGACTLKSPPSSCSQTSGPSISYANGGHQPSTNINTITTVDVIMTENPDGMQQRAYCDAELHASILEEPKLFPRSETHKSLGEHPNMETPSSWNSRDGGAHRIKATFGDEKIRFSMQPNWSFRDLQLEIARRFNLNDVSNIDLKYLDDEREWVLLTCDADLEECKDINRSSQSRTIRLSLFQGSPVNLASSFGNTSPS
ncbi:Nodule inception protein [Quillaja saponaria]|uniref:Nodule inception protein n=1 Tax=Quillaja saponaria TaxID=32244 RepID=A0AAD7QBX7_QUISA|nr:Nodule inception protein [Quillaja saponaria]